MDLLESLKSLINKFYIVLLYESKSVNKFILFSYFILPLSDTFTCWSLEERLAIRSSPGIDAPTTGGSLGSGEAGVRLLCGKSC